MGEQPPPQMAPPWKAAAALSLAPRAHWREADTSGLPDQLGGPVRGQLVPLPDVDFSPHRQLVWLTIGAERQRGGWGLCVPAQATFLCS